MEEGGSWETIELMSAIKKLSTDKVRWATKEKGRRCRKSRNFAEVNVKSLSDDDSYDQGENISEQDICFLLMPNKIIITKYFGSQMNSS